MDTTAGVEGAIVAVVMVIIVWSIYIVELLFQKLKNFQTTSPELQESFLEEEYVAVIILDYKHVQTNNV